MTDSVLVADDRDLCPVGWAGCDNYTGGHLCHRDHSHRGNHRCDCGAEKRRTANDDQFCGCCGVNATPNMVCSACQSHVRGGRAPIWERIPETCPVEQAWAGES